MVSLGHWELCLGPFELGPESTKKLRECTYVKNLRTGTEAKFRPFVDTLLGALFTVPFKGPRLVRCFQNYRETWKPSGMLR